MQSLSCPVYILDNFSEPSNLQFPPHPCFLCCQTCRVFNDENISTVLGNFNFSFYRYFLSFSVWQTAFLHLIIPPSEVLCLSMLWHSDQFAFATVSSCVMFTWVAIAHRTVTWRTVQACVWDGLFLRKLSNSFARHLGHQWVLAYLDQFLLWSLRNHQDSKYWKQIPKNSELSFWIPKEDWFSLSLLARLKMCSLFINSPSFQPWYRFIANSPWGPWLMSFSLSIW